MSAWSRLCNFKKGIFAFFGKCNSLRQNFQNSFQKVYTASSIDVLCSNFVKFGLRKIGEIVCYYQTKKFRLPLELSLLCGSHPKCRAGPIMSSQRSRFNPNRFTFGGVIGLAKGVNTAKSRRKVNPIFGWRILVSLGITNLWFPCDSPRSLCCCKR